MRQARPLAGKSITTAVRRGLQFAGQLEGVAVRGGPFYNRYNWLGAFRAFYVFTNPLAFIIALVRHSAPPYVRVRTPIGRITLRLRNFENLKTLFSIFCRQDYRVSGRARYLFLDIGANVGFASAYFLSRNDSNIVQCFEPDISNLDHLKGNLANFPERATISDQAIHVSNEVSVLYRSPDGKHSSLHFTDRAWLPHQAVSRKFADVLAEAAIIGLPTIIKIDVEGTEGDLVQSVKFEEYPFIQRLIVEANYCSKLITRPHTRRLRNGYVEDLTFAI
jgi:FkbM family methyltransferase